MTNDNCFINNRNVSIKLIPVINAYAAQLIKH